MASTGIFYIFRLYLYQEYLMLHYNIQVTDFFIFSFIYLFIFLRGDIVFNTYIGNIVWVYKF